MCLTELIISGDGRSSRSKLEERFEKDVQDPSLKPLLPVIKGLMRMLPSDRISASQALDLLQPPSKTVPERRRGHDGTGRDGKEQNKKDGPGNGEMKEDRMGKAVKRPTV